MVTNTFWFCRVLICSILSVAVLISSFFLSKDRRDFLKENLLAGGLIGMGICALFGWGMIFCVGDAREAYFLIPNENVEIHKTPVTYVVDFDKESVSNYTRLEDCYVLDDKESLYFYKKVTYNYYNSPDRANYLFKRKPIVTEMEEN